MTDNLVEKTLSTEMIYEGKIVKLHKDEVELVTGQKKKREVINHPGGVVVAAITDDQNILLVKQYRYPVKKVLIELPAGKLEYGEDPDDAIKRELIEECGYKANKWEKITTSISTPGFCDEVLHLYKATELVQCERTPEDGEILEFFSVPVDEAWKMVKDGRIVDLKSVALIGFIMTEK